MSELAFVTIWAVTFLREISAQRAFGLIFGACFLLPDFGGEGGHLVVVSISRSFGNCIGVEVVWDQKGSLRHLFDQVLIL